MKRCPLLSIKQNNVTLKASVMTLAPAVQHTRVNKSCQNNKTCNSQSRFCKLL